MNTSLKILELKKKLSEEIQKESSDNNVILDLSSEIAKLLNVSPRELICE